jgi:micrococcal nuclease
MMQKGLIVAAIASFIIFAAIVLVPSLKPAPEPATMNPLGPAPAQRCTGSASCFSGTVTRVVDGDTIDVNDVRVRLALVNTPEKGEPGYSEAGEFTAGMCPVGSTALVDEDDLQTGGSYGRMVAKVFCGGRNLNADLLEAGHATILARYCSGSEFAGEEWAVRYGC